MWRRFLYNLCNTCHLWICHSWYCHVLSIIHFVSAFSFLHRIQGYTAYYLFLKGKTKMGKCHKNAFHTCQIQFSVLKFLLITAVMSPFGPSQSCNTLHHPKRLGQKSISTRGLYRVISSPRDRGEMTCGPSVLNGLWSCLAVNGLLITCYIDCVRRMLPSRSGGDYIQWVPWNWIQKMCRLQWLT